MTKKEILRIVIVDDSYKWINQILSRQHNQKVLGSFTGGLEAIEFIQELQPDVVICGIETVILDGLEPIAALGSVPMFIVLVDESHYASIKNLGPDTIGYPILKRPVDEERLLTILNQLAFPKNDPPIALPLPSTQGNDDKNWFLKFHSGFFRVDVQSVRYFESEQGQVTVHLEGEEKEVIDVMVSMKTLERALPQDYFLRIHKSYIVNLNKVTHLDSHEVYIDNKPLPIGRAYKQKVKQMIFS